MYNDIVDKILKIIDEDKKQPEQILRFDLNKMLISEIDSIKEFSYELGYENCREETNNNIYYK